MRISFSGKYAENVETFGVDFEALIDGRRVVCVVSSEALDDVNPSGRFNDALAKYQHNKYRLEEVARKKILAGYEFEGKVYINQEDVV